jgi:PAS domain S-box-containing protein
MQRFEETIKLLENSSFYYLIAIGMDGNYSYVSPNYDRNFRYQYNTLLDRPFHVTMHPEDVKICQEVAGKCFDSPEGLFHATLRKHDGRGGYIFTQWEFKAIIDSENQRNGIFCIGYNITEQIATQSALTQANHQVNEQNEKLHQIAFINSHLVRRPLANILGLTGVLNQMELNENLRTLVKMIAESAAQLDLEVKNINYTSG